MVVRSTDQNQAEVEGSSMLLSDTRLALGGEERRRGGERVHCMGHAACGAHAELVKHSIN